MLYSIFFTLGLWFLGIQASSVAQRRNSELQGHKIVKLKGIEPSFLVDLMQLDADVWNYDKRRQEVTMRVDPEQYMLLKHMPELEMKVLNDDLQKLANGEIRRISMQAKKKTSGGDSWFTEFHRYSEIKRWCMNLAERNREIVRFVPSIGKTHQGRDIFAVHVNITPPRPDKKQIWIQGLIHAREWISGAIVQYLSEKLVKNSDNPRFSAIRDIEFIIIPVVNPDGYEYTWTTNRLWRKNMAPAMFGRGVDLNRNFDDHWGQGGASKIPISDTFQGPSPASEPETQAIQRYFKKHHNIVGAIDWHCYSQLILFPHGWTSDRIENYEQYVELTRLMARAFSLNGRTYIPEQSSDLYATTGSATDWFVGKKTAMTNNFRPFSLAVELPPSATEGSGFIMDPKHIISTGEESWAAFFEFVKYSSKNAPAWSRKEPRK